MLQDALRKTAGRLSTLEEGRATEAPGIWQDFAAGLFQGVVVTSTLVGGFARYELQGKTVRVQAKVIATGAGTAFATIAISGLPFAPLYHDAPLGVLEVFDASAGRWYSGPARTQAGFGSGLYAWGIASGAANVMGSDTPAIALANGDYVSLFGTYEID